MLAGLLLLALQHPATAPPDSVVARSLAAIEHGMAARQAQSLRAALRRDPGDRGALLGLATLARLQYRHRAADSLYHALQSAAPDGYTLLALLGEGEGLASRGNLPAARDRFAAAERLAGERHDSGARVQALLGLAAVVGPAVRDGAEDSLFLRAADLLPAGRPALDARLRCARAGPPFLPGELPEVAEARAGAALALTAGDRRQHAACVLSIGRGHYRAGALDSARYWSTVAADLQAAVHDTAALAFTRQWRGYAALTSGDYGAAWRDLHAGLALAEASGAGQVQGLASLYLASLALRFGDVIAARGHADRADTLFTRLGIVRTLTTLRGIQGDIARAIGDTAGARRRYEAALAQSGRFTGYPVLAPHRALATLARQRGDWAEAERQLALAREAALASGLAEWEQRLRYDAAALAVARGDDTRAARELRQFLATLSPEEHRRGFAARVRLAELAARSGDAAGAERLLGEATDSLEAARIRLNEPALRLMAFQIRDDDADPDLGFASIIAVLAADGRTAAAFRLVEARRARELFDQLLRARALTGAPAPARTPWSVADLGALRAALGTRATALVLFVTGQGGEPTTALVVSADRLDAVPLAPIDSLRPRLGAFLDLVESGGHADGLARDLGAALLDPILRRLDPGVRELIFVPDAGLHRIPFDALRLAAGAPLLTRYGVTLAPSASILMHLWARPVARGPARLLGVGDPGPGAGGAASLRQGGHPIPRAPLPYARREVRRLARFADEAAVRTGVSASEAWVKSAMAERWSVLHFASHALVDELALPETGLVLAAGGGEDGFLQAGEIATLPLQAELVVLSACRSAGGVAVLGEGVRGLAAPFLEAGAAGVVGSLWPVEDRAASELMLAFYRGMARGRSAGAALREAKLAALTAGRPVREWSGFTLTGNPGLVLPLHQPVESPWWVVPIALVVATGAGWWWRRRRA